MSLSNKMFISFNWNVEQFIINMCFNATIQYNDYNPKRPTRNCSKVHISAVIPPIIKKISVLIIVQKTWSLDLIFFINMESNLAAQI